VPTTPIDDFSNIAAWQALTPGNAASAEIALAAETGSPALPAGGAVLRADFSANSDDHRIERGFAPVDLGERTELRFWARTSAPATGEPLSPFRLRVRLGSAALPIGAGGNLWVRQVPAPAQGRWGLVRLALDDLPPAVRSAVNAIEIRSVAVPAGGAHALRLADLHAARPEMAVDANDALVAALHEVLSLNGAPVKAAIIAPGASTMSAPFIRIVPYDAAFAPARAGQARRRGDFTLDEYRIWPEPEPWDLFYRIEPVTSDAGEQAALLDFVVVTLGSRGLLPIGGIGHVIDRVANVQPDDAAAPAPLLRYRIGAWRDKAGGAASVRPVGAVRLDTGMAA
jgi:hypothetical protein